MKLKMRIFSRELKEILVINEVRKFIYLCPNCGINGISEDCKYTLCDECKKEQESFSILLIEDFLI